MVRYQVVNIYLAAGTAAGVARKTVELFKDVKRCTGVYVVGSLNDVYGDMYLTLKDNVRNHINRLSLNFLVGNLGNGSEVNIANRIYLHAAGKRFEVELEHGSVTRNTNISVVFELDDEAGIPENILGYHQQIVTIPAATTGIHKTPLFNLPSDYKRVVGVRVEGYAKMSKGGTVGTYYVLQPNVHNVSLRTESEIIALDFVPQKMLMPQVSNRRLSQKFFPVNIPVSDALSLWFDKSDNAAYVDDFQYEVTFLLTNDV